MELKFDEKGLIPAIVQEHYTKEVLTLAYMNAESLAITIDEGRTYTVGTIDFLAEGNDGMAALPRASQRQCPEGATRRGLFLDYVERETAAGRKIEARIEGRVVMKK